MSRNKPQKPLTEAPPEPESDSETGSSSDQQPSGPSNDVTAEEQEEEDTSSSAATASSDDEEEEEEQPVATPQPPSKKPTTAVSTTVTRKQTTPPTSDDDDDDTDDEPPVAKLKPTQTQTQAQAQAHPKPRSRPTVSALIAEKRPAEITPEKDTSKSSSKRAKKEKPDPASGPNDDVSKKLFQRVFSESDEIALLKGLGDFKARKGGDPLKNDDEFYGFITKLLHVDVNKVQIVDKVRRLKRKFQNAKKKKVMNAHEKKLFELSKKIWEEEDGGEEKEKSKEKSNLKEKEKDGNVVVKNSKLVSNSKEKEKDKEKEMNGVVVVASANMNAKEDNVDEMEEDFRVGELEVKEGVRLEALRRMGAKGRAEIREMWRKVERAQMEVERMRSEARVEENKRIMEAMGWK